MDLPEVPERIARFEQWGYGLFLHWGLYSLLNRGEWTMAHHSVARPEYARLMDQFTADAWDAPALVQWAKRAGFRYICLTTRHHDGFSLYDTRGLSAFDAPHSPAKRDLVREFADACQAQGMGLFFYHTTLDWKQDSFDQNWDAYQQYLRDSVEILCRHYGPVDGFWFDGNWARPHQDWQEDALYGLIRRLQPQAILINNSSTQALGQRGHPEVDVLTFEQGAPTVVEPAATQKYVARERCDTLSSHWGAASAGDFSFQGPAQIITKLAQCRGAGANLLLNVGPLASGALPAYERAALDVVGHWIERCPGGSLYAGRPTKLLCSGTDFVLQTPDAFYLFVFDLGITGNMHLGGDIGRRETVAGALPTVRTIQWTDNGEPLRFTQSVDGTLLTLAATANPYGTQPVVRVARIECE
ncbi:MAG: alpha-L-fucosidase [Cytophagales bacterium]|nr:alpha-L-fucosidase [Armatimonadota bacterium]